MRYNTLKEYKQEIARIDAAMKRTDSVWLHRDYGKYKRKLEKEMRCFRGEEIPKQGSHSRRDPV